MTEASLPLDLTAKHVRAARALLAWSQQDLAKAAAVATSTVADFERGRRTPVANNSEAMREALERAGVTFLAGGAIIGPPIPRISIASGTGTPVRWVTVGELSTWADRLDGSASLPTIVAHLICATHGTPSVLRFPADEGIRFRGWDGRTVTDRGSPYVPAGETVWEMGAQKTKIADKADKDYRKRTDNPGSTDPSESTYVWITPRQWPGKDDWAKARQAEGIWKEVRVYDGNDLVHWIEQAPAVGQWLATRLGKRPPGTLQLEDIWEEWSLATDIPLTEELILSDRDEDAKAVLLWLRGDPAILSIQGDTTEEVAAFLHATLAMLPEEAAAHYRARCLVVIADAARTLIYAPGPLILVLTEPDAGLARRLANHGHYVLQGYDDRPVGGGGVRRLARPSREGIASALVNAGLSAPKAESLARDSARNLARLRRLIPSAPDRLPTWAQEPPPRALLAALLAGGWDEQSEGDKARLADLAGRPYDELLAELTDYAGDFDKPLRKVGSTWRVASPHDAWLLLARYLTSADIDRFEAVAHAVLGSADPRYDMNPDERWMAPLHGVRPDYSGLLRHGVGEVLILLALWGGEVSAAPVADRRAERIVTRLLSEADARRWWSLSRNFRLLAEAAPNAFLDAVEDSLDRNDPPIKALFGADEGGILPTEHLAGLLWALESLAWSPDLLPRVSLILARLDAIDNPPGKQGNRPANSLRDIHLLWMPQTFASLDQRLRAIDLIRKQENNAAWKLMLGILPRGHGLVMNSAVPRWRDFTVDATEDVTWPLLKRGAGELTDRLLADVNLSVPRWLTLLEHFVNLSPDCDGAIGALESAEPLIKDLEDRASLRSGLRRLLHHHRQFPDADWSLPASNLERLERIYNRLSPVDIADRMVWLFDQGACLPNPESNDFYDEQRELEGARLNAAKDVYDKQGAAGIFSMARRIPMAGFIGKALVDSGLKGQPLNQLLELSLRSDNNRERDVGHGIIVSIVGNEESKWADELVTTAKEQSWGETALLTLLRALPARRWVWKHAADAGNEIERAYWQRVATYLISDAEKDDLTYALSKLISVGRARHAVHLAGHDRAGLLDSTVIVDVLTEAVRQPFSDDGDSNEPTMFQYHVVELLNRLDQSKDISEEALVGLEWAYLQLLQYSRRPAKVLLKALSEHPALFVQMLTALYKPSEESGIEEPEPDDPEKARAIAHQAFQLLEQWDRIPGTRSDGTIDAEALEAWIKEARSLASKVGRGEFADSKIGTVLSASGRGADGLWPAEAVREVIDLFRSKEMIRGFWIGKRNRRGVTSRLPGEGGGLERTEAANYRKYADAIRYDHPQTARALNDLADSYEEDARRHDEDAERLDWGA